jgi:hypothetical protein
LFVVVPLKFIYSSVPVSDALVLIVLFKLVNFVFEIFPLCILEMSAGFMSYILQFQNSKN